MSSDGVQRGEQIVDVLTTAFTDLMAADGAAFRAKFRKMARDPFAFYRGTACLYYADVGRGGDCHDLDEPWMDDDGRRVWIQGDLHAENFGTYLDAGGRLVFDVNDFDEAYLGHWTWDLRRFVASLALLCWQKALPDDAIAGLVEAYARGYLEQVRHYVEVADDTEWALTLDNAEGAVLDSLRTARMRTRVGLLDRVTVVDGYQRRFTDGAHVRRLDDDERGAVVDAFARYIRTIPEDKRLHRVTFDVLDVVGRYGFGIGSAGLPAYNVLIEGFTQALDNDVVLTMKQGNVAAPSRVVRDEALQRAFHHEGHRTALSQRALQARSDRFLGWTELRTPATGTPEAPREPTGVVVAELSPYEADLAWDDVSEPEEVHVLVRQLGRATAKVHCVADDDSDHDLVDVSVERVVARGVEAGGGDDALVADLQSFARDYARRTRADHALFVDAFRGGAFSGVAPVRGGG